VTSQKSKILDHPLLKERRARVQGVLGRFKERGLDPETFCIMPFVNIILEPNGSVGLCRHLGTEFSMGNVQDQSLAEIWNGEKTKRWRREFLEGKPIVCKEHLRHRKCQLCPELNRMMDAAPLQEIIDGPPLRLTPNLNGRCNLRCQMCDVWQLPNGFYTEENFWIPARELFFPHVKEIDMLSGEPFLQADTFRLIQEIAPINPDCEWSITTNAHWKLTDKVISHLDMIKVKNLIISVDSLVPEVYAKIRTPGRLDTVLATINDLLEYQKARLVKGQTGLGINVNFLIQKDNWNEIKNMVDYCLAIGVNPFIHFCYIPTEHSLLSLTEKERMGILDWYLANLNWEYLTMAKLVTSPLIGSLSPIDQAHYLNEFGKIKSDFESEKAS
jgi:cyclic pyranopterin phosphate synthase